jgi:uncharacterized phosphosugar-binding protein
LSISEPNLRIKSLTYFVQIIGFTVKADNIRNYAQLVIDTCTDAEDTVVDVDGKHKAGQLNTICGNVLAQMITAETYRYLKNHDMACPVLLSVNVKGADAYNRKISDQYIGRWNS